jgi:hypothetical protein
LLDLGKADKRIRRHEQQCDRKHQFARHTEFSPLGERPSRPIHTAARLQKHLDGPNSITNGPRYQR